LTPERSHKIKKVLSQRQCNITVVLENVQDPHNIQAVLRTCESVGIAEVFAVNNNGHMTLDDYVTRASRSANKWVPIHYFEDVTDCMNVVRSQYSLVYAAYLNTNSNNVYNIDLTSSIALVFGNERDGITNQMLSCVDGTFIIPQMGFIESLNISVACAVTLYEAFRQKSAAGHYLQNNLPDTKTAELLKFWNVGQGENGDLDYIAKTH
jgi:tRNA (guanosine-2'-O-)-methyltransferase